MKKQIITCLSIGLSLALVACSKYDDTEVLSRLDKAESRLTTIEDRVNSLNKDLEKLRTLTEAISQGKYVTSISPVTDGYKIIFSDNQEITLRHGAKGDKGDTGAQGLPGATGATGATGAAGHSPQISVALDNGVYYWQVDGSWLLDSSGSKISASGTQGSAGQTGATGATGQAGITPKLRINNSIWEVSYNEGASWQSLGVNAVGPKGDAGYSPQGANIFTSISNGANEVMITLSGGSVLKIPKGGAFTINLSQSQVTVAAGAEVQVNYTINGGLKGAPKVTAEGHDGYQVKVNRNFLDRGTLVIKAPSTAPESEVWLFAGDDERTIMQPIKINVASTTVTP